LVITVALLTILRSTLETVKAGKEEA